MTERLRVDKWLWYARLCKTRALAGTLCAEGAVDLDGARIDRPARPVKVGTEVTLRQRGWEQRVKVLALGTRRGPATEARGLYEVVVPARALPVGDGSWVPLLTLDD